MEYTDCWLQYKRLSDDNQSELILYRNNSEATVITAADELKLAFWSLYGRKITLVSNEDDFKNSKSGLFIQIDKTMSAGKEGYHIQCTSGKCIISAASGTGALYGVYVLIRNLVVLKVCDFDKWSFREDKEPSAPLRMLNHWDNMDGSIERGYSGNSFFFRDNEVLADARIKAYARMTASVGINAAVINNVNVGGNAIRLISDRYYDQLKKISEIFISYGIKLFLSINFAAPMELSGIP